MPNLRRESQQMWRGWRSAVILGTVGLAYGLALAVMGVMAAGAGHGTYVVIGLASSPFGLLQNVVIGLLGAPVLWGIAGLLLSAVRDSAWRAVFLAVMFAHYGGLLLVLFRPSPFADWSHASKMPEFVAEVIGFYIVGQTALWATFAFVLRRSETGGSESSQSPPDPPSCSTPDPRSTSITVVGQIRTKDH